MNQHDESDEAQSPPPFPPPLQPLSLPNPPLSARFLYWVRRCLACNPFYLVSAALLLYGFYRVSIDPNFLRSESSQLFFNFTALQCYEVLLVGTAICLAARRIWYDSTLLVALENGFLFVPFVLVSQAALIDMWIVWVMCGVAAGVAVLRVGSLKRFFGELNLPNRLLGVGLTLLVINVALPVIYRVLHENKVGTKLELGAAYEMNEWAWLAILPAAFASANFLPHAREIGSLLPQRRWLPAGLFLLWITATSVHLYCLGYVYDFDLRPDLIAPALWVLVWTASRRATDLLGVRGEIGRGALQVLPVLAAFPGLARDGKVFLALATLNLFAYAGSWLMNRRNRITPHLLFASALMVAFGLSRMFTDWLSPEWRHVNYPLAGGVAYVLFYVTLYRTPNFGLFGAALLTASLYGLLQNFSGAGYWACQSGFGFLLLHSLLWDDAANRNAGGVRVVAAAGWVLHSILWTRAGGEAWMLCSVAAIVLAGYFAARCFRGDWSPLILPVAAVLVILAGPGNAAAHEVHSAPAGLLAVIGSFVLFGAGTVAALTKDRWHHNA